MITGTLPFDDDKLSVVKQIIAVGKFEFPEEIYVNPKLKELISGMLEKDKNKRLKMYEILENSWLFPDNH